MSGLLLRRKTTEGEEEQQEEDKKRREHGERLIVVCIVGAPMTTPPPKGHSRSHSSPGPLPYSCSWFKIDSIDSGVCRKRELSHRVCWPPLLLCYLL